MRLVHKLLIAGFAVALMATGVAQAWDNPFTGVWVGEARYDVPRGSDQPFRVAIVITDGGTSLIDYQTYGCGGELVYQNEDVPGTAVYLERLTYGQESCIDGGKVTLTVNEKGIAYRYASPSGIKEDAAGGQLDGRPIGAEPTACEDCPVYERLEYHTCGGIEAARAEGEDPAALAACFRAAGQRVMQCRQMCRPTTR
ncbi:MAG TPA: hypothetical protein PL096_00915 [Micropepsaceae bacterium]|nr:hypothetical protein [Micropepsaceae bacterium]